MVGSFSSGHGHLIVSFVSSSDSSPRDVNGWERAHNCSSFHDCFDINTRCPVSLTFIILLSTSTLSSLSLNTTRQCKLLRSSFLLSWLSLLYPWLFLLFPTSTERTFLVSVLSLYIHSDSPIRFST